MSGLSTPPRDNCEVEGCYRERELRQLRCADHRISTLKAAPETVYGTTPGQIDMRLVEPQPVDPDARQITLKCEIVHDRTRQTLVISGRIWNLIVYEPKGSKDCAEYTLVEDGDGKLIGEIAVNATSGVLSLCEWSRKIVAMFLTQNWDAIYKLMEERQR